MKKNILLLFGILLISWTPLDVFKSENDKIFEEVYQYFKERGNNVSKGKQYNYYFLEIITINDLDELKQLLKLKRIGQLKFQGNSIREEHFNILSQFEEISQLTLENINLSEKSAKYLSITKISFALDLVKVGISDTSFQIISNGNINPSSLWLHNMYISDDSLKYIGNMNNIESIWIDKCQNITDRSIEYLVKLEKLDNVRIRNMNITDVGLLTFLKSDDKYELFRRGSIDLTNNKVTDNGVEKFCKGVVIKKKRIREFSEKKVYKTKLSVGKNNVSPQIIDKLNEIDKYENYEVDLYTEIN